MDTRTPYSHTVDRVQELCESPGLPVPNSPYALSGRKATLNLNTQWTVTAQRVMHWRDEKTEGGGGGGGPSKIPTHMQKLRTPA